MSFPRPTPLSRPTSRGRPPPTSYAGPAAGGGRGLKRAHDHGRGDLDWAETAGGDGQPDLFARQYGRVRERDDNLLSRARELFRSDDAVRAFYAGLHDGEDSPMTDVFTILSEPIRYRGEPKAMVALKREYNDKQRAKAAKKKAKHGGTKKKGVFSRLFNHQAKAAPVEKPLRIGVHTTLKTPEDLPR
jgi:hypothetical protein